jgi:omega-amidase
MNDLRVSIIQADLYWEDKSKNLKKFENYFTELKGRQDLVVLPEMFSTGFIVETRSLAEKKDGPTMDWMRMQAGNMGCVITGSLVIEEEGQIFNRLVWMRPDGTCDTYDKRHLFRFGNEHLQFSGGNRKLVTELNGWKICPMVCYDLRFPVWSKNTYANGKYEYDLLLYIANWPGRRSYAYRHLLIARAIENQAYVIGVNRVGTDGKGTLHQGDSAVRDYLGKHMIEIPPDVEDVETIVLDYQKLLDFRAGFTVGLDWDQFDITL